MAVAVRVGRPAGLRVVLALSAAAVLLCSCAAQTVVGRPVAQGEIDAGTVAGLPVENGPSGPRAGVADAELTVENADHGEEDRLALNALSDIYDYWGERLPADFGGQRFDPPKRLVSYDSNGKALKLCGSSSAGLVNAFYCGQDDSVSWDRGELLPALSKQFGQMSVVAVLAHEMGHAVQFRLGEKSNMSQSSPTILKEQQADCYAGGFFRWVAEGHAKHFQINTGDGLNKILATMFFIRDPAGLAASTKGAHGLAFDRVFAFQEGFSNGPKRCAAMNVDEINKRIAEKQRNPTEESKGDDAKLSDQEVMTLFKQGLDKAFAGNSGQPPQLKTDGARCQDGKQTPPVTFCADQNVVVADLDALQKIATPPKRGQEPGADGAGIGDFAAFAEMASRYTLSVQKSIGQQIDDEKAGLRTACLVGAWAAFANKAPEPDEGKKLVLAVNDLDEAVAELLQDNSLIAADINGKQVPSGFARVQAFQAGFLQGSRSCATSFS